MSSLCQFCGVMIAAILSFIAFILFIVIILESLFTSHG